MKSHWSGVLTVERIIANYPGGIMELYAPSVVLKYPRLVQVHRPSKKKIVLIKVIEIKLITLQR